MHYGRCIVSLDTIELLPTERALVAHPHTAAVLLFSRNYTSPQQLRALVAAIVYHSGKDDLPIFVDQEGGQIQRFRGPGFHDLSDFRSLGQAGLAAIDAHAKALTSDLAPFGLISLTPVADLDAGNSVISGKRRALSADPQDGAELLTAYVNALHRYGHSATLKHFPGHGQSYGVDQDDSHHCQPVDRRSLEEIFATDLVPFVANAQHAEAIMTAHITYTEVDAQHPAGFSAIWLQKILREQLGFQGIIVSDCLSMAGAGDDSLLDRTIQSLQYNDIAIMCNLPLQDTLDVLDNIPVGTLNEKQAVAFARWTACGRAQRAALATTYDKETTIS